MECGWIKFLKYKLASFFSDFLDVELPPKPFTREDHPMHLVGGRAGRFVHQILKTDRGLEFATGILYSKKGLPRPDEQMLMAAIIATKKVLTNPRPVPVSSIIISTPDWETPQRPLCLDDMEIEVRRVVQEVFHGQTMTVEDLEHPFAPSVKATYTASRSKLGTFGDFIVDDLIHDLKSLESYRATGPHHRLEQDPFAKIFSEAVELDKSEEEMEEEEGIERLRLTKAFRLKVQSVYSDLYRNVRAHASEEVANVKLVALPEALKIRVISKGPAYTYFTLKPVQKFLHRIMRKQRMFALIGETVSAEFLDKVLLGHQGQFHSLDYSSATDFLNPRLSEVCVEEICNVVGIPDDIRRMFRKALTGHLVEGEPQVWGQLMGSVVSFIVLCLVNAAVIRKSYEFLTGREASLDSIPAVVNGDDGAVRAPSSFLPLWKDVASLCGLEPSVGKVYSHDTYLNINSTSFTLVKDHLTLVPYVNLGLVEGMTRSGGVDRSTNSVYNDERFGSLGSRHHALMESCPPSLRLEVHKMFVRKQYNLLSSVRIPWFVPEELGGIGLRPFKVWNFGENVEDASWSYLEDDSVRYGPSDLDQDCMLALESKEFRSISCRRLPNSQPIQVRAVWSSRLGRPIRDCEMSESDIGFLDVASYYLAPSLVSEQLATNFNVVLRRNERAWDCLTRRVLRGRPL
jgi:hypothetical protein